MGVEPTRGNLVCLGSKFGVRDFAVLADIVEKVRTEQTGMLAWNDISSKSPIANP